MIGFYILTVVLIIVAVIAMVAMIKFIIYLERSQYYYWDKDELTMRTYDEIN